MRNLLSPLSGAALSLAFAALASGHGSMSAPLSRVYNGFLENPQSPTSAAVQAAIAVGGTQPFYDWNEVVNFIPGQPQSQMNYPYHQLIPDGQIASGGNSKYAGLDLVRDDWPTTPISSGPFEMVWYATTPHDPSVFHAWITAADWTPALPLTWDKLDPLPLGPVMLMQNEYRFNTVIPPRSGKHCIYVVWQRIDPAGEGFYSISDVDFGEGPIADCPGDLTEDGRVDGADLAAVLAAWGGPGGDLDGDGVTDGADLAAILAAWGPCGPDCDGDGVSDAEAIAAGAPDCNANGIPDSCEALEDCDGDGIIDLCAILLGLVADCNLNLIPDSCEIAAGGDANGDGFLDACQIEGLTFTWTVTSEWSGGFVASLGVHNGSTSMIHGWTLTFDTPGYTIQTLWDGVLIGQESGVATVANEHWNGHLHPGESFAVGFVANGAAAPPTSVILNQSPAAPGG
ncbi:MAG TPA: lytic polysaccharide monooxygenase [Phycisphaerales bacterium]|nr:lytic polysaccharide monooxygenase [Phycisphaerales bacterium]HMP37656.1 lytic polysaccharide monooxygenase [Phycisphaerales bacterium]